jgi:beta-galactosidase/beta-glucuronidase
MMKRTNSNSDDGPVKKVTRVVKNTLAERMAHVSNAAVPAVPAGKPKIILMSIGNDTYNLETMTRECYIEHGCNAWTIADRFVQDVKLGDIIISTGSGDASYNTIHTVTGLNTITSDTYHAMYKPIPKNTNYPESKDHRSFIMKLGNRQEVNISKNVAHTKLGFKGIKCMNLLKGHFNGKLDPESVPAIWCLKSNYPEANVIRNYNRLRDMCMDMVNHEETITGAV